MPSKSEDEKIIEAYFRNNYNKTKAYKGVMGCQYQTAASNSYKFFKRPDIAERVQAHFEEQIKEFKETLDTRVLDHYISRAFYDVSDILDEQGELVEGVMKNPKLSCCIDAIIVTPGKHGDKTEIRLADKDKALAQLAKYRQLMVDKVEHSGTVQLAETRFVIEGSSED